MRYLPRGRVRATALVAAVVALAGAGLAYAQIPGPDGVIHACYVKSGGALRVIDSAAKCKTTETSLNWNQKGATGARGATGVTGPTGPSGPAGPSGAAGVSGRVVVTHSTDYTNFTSSDPTHYTTFAICPSGTKPMGGGGFVQLYNDSGFLQVGDIASSQLAASDNSWSIDANPPSVAGVTKMTVNVELICATAS